MEETKVQTKLTKEEALQLLFADKSKKQVGDDCFDSFGNYIFPTDLVLDAPNIAFGSSDGYRFLHLLDVNKK